jgi:TolB-like protein
MAPEQLARGETTIQSDLYSLGLILYEAFTGQPVHNSGSNEELNRAHAARSPRSPAELVADLDPAVERAILHSLQKDPRQRPASARAVADALVARETPSPGSPPRESPPEGKPSLAVLPFVNMNADHENEFLSDGITEDLIMALSRLKDLRVPARTSSFAFKGKNEDIRRIGQLLNVETVLEGSVRKSGNRLRVTAQLVKVRDGFHLWSERYDREMKYDFLPCREALTKAKTTAEQAVALDDNAAEAHCSLGVVLGWCDWDLYGSEQHLLKALELNSNYSWAGCWYAWLLILMGRDQESIAQHRRAVEGDPLSRTPHLYLGMSFNSLRWFAEALPPLRRSLELEPNSAISHQQLGRAYWFLGDREAALVELHRAVALSGRLPMFLSTLGQALALSGEVGQARQIQRELAERTIPAHTRPYFLSHLHAALGENDLAFAALEQALVEHECFLAWFPGRRSHVELMSSESDPRWPVFIEKVKAAVQASANETI